MMRACLSASHSTKRTTSIVTTPFRAAPSATVANSSSERATDPVRRTVMPLSGVNLNFAIVARMAFVAAPPGWRSPKLRTGWMFTNRRNSDGSGARDVISFRQEKGGRLPSARRSRASAIAVTAGLRSSSVVFFRRSPSIDCEMAPRMPRNVGSAASVPRKGSALINAAVSRRTSSMVSKRMPLRAKNSPPSGRLIMRTTSGRGVSASTNAVAASSAASGVVESMTAMIRSVRWGKSWLSRVSCWRQGRELDSSLLLSVVMAIWRET